MKTISEIKDYTSKITHHQPIVFFIDYSGSLSSSVCSICGSSKLYQNHMLICKSCQRDKMINEILK